MVEPDLKRYPLLLLYHCPHVHVKTKKDLSFVILRVNKLEAANRV